MREKRSDFQMTTLVCMISFRIILWGKDKRNTPNF